MKAIKLFGLLFLATLAVSSCKKDDETAASVSGASYETTYYEMSFSAAGVSDLENEKYDTKAELENANMYEVMTFQADGTLLIDDDEAGTWEQSGKNVTIESYDETLVFKVSGNDLVINESESAMGMTVKMVLKYSKI